MSEHFQIFFQSQLSDIIEKTNFFEGLRSLEKGDYANALGLFRQSYCVEGDSPSSFAHLVMSYFIVANARNGQCLDTGDELNVVLETALTMENKQIVAEIYYLMALEKKSDSNAYSKFLKNALSFADSSIGEYQFRKIELLLSEIHCVQGVELKGKERELYEFLKSGARDKFELVRLLYGEEKDFLLAEKKFKTLLYRLRKKIPQDIILNNQNCYQLIDL